MPEVMAINGIAGILVPVIKKVFDVSSIIYCCIGFIVEIQADNLLEHQSGTFYQTMYDNLIMSHKRDIQ